jgi:hypothetical protein
VWLLAAAAVVVTVSVGLGVVRATTGPEDPEDPPLDGGGSPTATVVTFAATPPDGLGDDPALDQLADYCYQGYYSDCDTLWSQSRSGSPYEMYGGTCAGRVEYLQLTSCSEIG